MKTIAEVAEWCDGTAGQFGDPAKLVCQLFFRWVQDPCSYRGEDLVCGMFYEQFGLWLSVEDSIALPVVKGECELDMIGIVKNFGATEISTGVWALAPSLNLPGCIHGFIVLYDVPSPAPWERRIVLIGNLA